MPLEVNSPTPICYKCGTAYTRRKGYFPVSYSTLHKGMGYTHICKDCIDAMYNAYLSQCNSVPDAIRQVCRKLDIYWNENAFRQVEIKSTTRSMMTKYIAKINTTAYVGKSYDDTLLEEGTLWNFNGEKSVPETEYNSIQETNPDEEGIEEVSDEVRRFWGAGYTPKMYIELEERRAQWMSRLPNGVDVDIGTEAIIKQICSLELDINRDRAAGKAVDKNVNALNSLLGSANLKPTQKKDDPDSSYDNTPFGVWIKRWEDQKPIPEPDPELKDVDGIVRYIETWFKGHLAKMLNIKNAYSKLYEEEIAKIRVNHPEYQDDDDETVFNDIFGRDNESEEV